MKKNEILTIIRTAVILLLVTGITVLLLAVVNHFTEGPIEKRRAEELKASIYSMFPDTEYSEIESAELSFPATALYKVTKNGKTVGFLVTATPMGFGGEVGLLCGFDPDGTCVGVKVTEHSETKSKFDAVNSEENLSQYKGKTGSFRFSSEGGIIDAVSGSTVSSQAILDGVNGAYQTVRSQILRERGNG